MELKKNLDNLTLKQLILMKNWSKHTALDILIVRNECDNVENILIDTLKAVGNEKIHDFITNSRAYGDNMMQLVAARGSLKVNITFWMEIKRYMKNDTLKELILKSNNIGETPFHMLISRDLFEIIQMLIDDINKLFGEKTLYDLVSPRSIDEQTMLIYIANHSSNIKTFKIFWIGIKKYLNQKELRQLILYCDNMKQNVLHILIDKGQSEHVQILLNEFLAFSEMTLDDLMQIENNHREKLLYFVASHGSKEIFQIFWNQMTINITNTNLKGHILSEYSDGFSLLHILALKNKYEIIELFVKGVNEHFGKITLEEVMLKGDIYGKNALQIALSNNNNKSIEILLENTKEYLGVPVLKKMILNQNQDGKNAFQHAKSTCNSKMYNFLIELAKTHIDISVLNELWHNGLV